MNPRRRDVPPLVLLVLIGTQRPSFSLPFFLALNHSRGKIAAVDEEASGWGFRPLCGDNSSYTRYPGKGLPDEILEEKALSLSLSFLAHSLRSRPLGWSAGKRRSTVAGWLVPGLSILSDASISAYRFDSISPRVFSHTQSQMLTKSTRKRHRVSNIDFGFARYSSNEGT